MFVEFFVEVFYIKIKIHGYIENKREKTRENIETSAIKNNNKLKFNHKEVIYSIINQEKKLILTRENAEFKQIITFDLNKKTECLYYIKEYMTEMRLKIITKMINVNDNLIDIDYLIEETQDEFKYLLEMSE